MFVLVSMRRVLSSRDAGWCASLMMMTWSRDRSSFSQASKASVWLATRPRKKDGWPTKDWTRVPCMPRVVIFGGSVDDLVARGIECG